ncbi:hypothetical protein J3458_009318 [Metarhizium acridum]|uniref:Uncharacterized protein n=1 Tax=Metarhizium acridum (strain CQMa 102) TaxID=655827 RepID=E9DT29_METAQ|nr:uncharacterized protein MAC_00911 [Metarhizium acridum CQMa 102]EFY93128.1 hypothetical protein MAC_00911 [Metarhizium acridum CQMa 102]KAG8415476.1 hypothetical protein J3458_009318 [Metarhizium acridum]
MDKVKEAVNKATSSSDSEKQFTTQPIQHGIDPKVAPHQAHPGPALTKDMPSEEGSKAEREARKKELNP